MGRYCKFTGTGIVLASVLAWAGIAEGQNATSVSLGVVEGADPGPFNSTRSVSDGFADAFTIWTQADTNGDMDGMQYRLRVNGGSDDSKFRITAYAEGPLSDIGASFDGLGDVFDLGGSPAGFAPGDYSKLTLPVALSAVPNDEVIFNFSLYVSGESFPGTVLGYVIEPVAALEAGDYVFSADGVWTASPSNGTLTSSGTFTLTVGSGSSGGGGGTGGGGGDGGVGGDPDPDPDPDADGDTDGDGDVGTGTDGDNGSDGDGDTGSDGGSGDGGSSDGGSGDGGSGDGGTSDGDNGTDGDQGGTPTDTPDTAPTSICGGGAMQTLSLSLTLGLGAIGMRRRRMYR